MASKATATIYYQTYTNPDAKHTDNNYEFLYDTDKDGQVSAEEREKGIKLTITREDIEAARKSATLNRP